MGNRGGGSDRSQAWRDSYRGVRKDPWRETQRTNRARLATLDEPALDRNGRWLDLGAGDGNLAHALRAAGVDDVVALEVQPELLAHCQSDVERIAASADALPFGPGSFDVVCVMDVLHHLTPAQLEPTLGEIRRVLRPGGTLLVWEPAHTVTRTVLGVALMSPLASLTAFSRHKRCMVEEERDTLEPWLAGERGFVSVASAAGFEVVRSSRSWMHVSHRFLRPGGPTA